MSLPLFLPFLLTIHFLSPSSLFLPSTSIFTTPPFHPSTLFPLPPSRYNLQTPLNASTRFKPPPPPFVPGRVKISREPPPSFDLFHLSPGQNFDDPPIDCATRRRNQPTNQPTPWKSGQGCSRNSRFPRGSFEASVAKLLNASRICSRRFQTRG